MTKTLFTTGGGMGKYHLRKHYECVCGEGYRCKENFDRHVKSCEKVANMNHAERLKYKVAYEVYQKDIQRMRSILESQIKKQLKIDVKFEDPK